MGVVNKNKKEKITQNLAYGHEKSKTFLFYFQQSYLIILFYYFDNM
jgi:hypothetical protein